MYILGINAFHGDSSACLVRDGKLVSAVEEERFRRIKHWAGFPSESIKFCLEDAGITIADVEHVAINSDPKSNIWKKVRYTLTNHPDFKLIKDRIKNAGERKGIAERIEALFPGGRFAGEVHRVDHHMAHLGSCFLVSPFENAVSISVDGFGDFASAAWGVGRGTHIDVEDRVYFPHSLGIFYQALTQYIGFPHYGDEYKVMGLAPYGKPEFMAEMREIVQLQNDGAFRLALEYFRHHNEKIEYEWDNGIPAVGTLFTPALEELLGPARGKGEELTQKHKDIAHSVQAMYEESFFHLLDVLHGKYQLDSLCLAGGCAMNSVANGKVYRRSSFRELYIQSAAGDAGGAIGAAFVVHHASNSNRDFVMDHAYYGPSYEDNEIATLLQERKGELDSENIRITHIKDEDSLCSKTVDAILDGKVIGWFQGRLEWGPRALGNRSILCDPRRNDMKEILNSKIKRRESFRPFAPSILREAVPDWFEEDDDVPFMMEVFQIREEKRDQIPSVTHADGSGRLQTVHKETNGRYYNLIKNFGDRTGVPILLNTSFNENEPVVCKPVEALECFLRTNMDVLVLGDWFIERLNQD